jgi:hypothetical protein
VPFSSTAPIAITLGIGAASSQTYTNSGGTTPYTCTSDNVGVATVSCAGNGTSMTITGVTDGKAKVLLQDATGTNSKTIDVNVATGTGLTVIGNSDWTIPEAHCNTPYTAYNPPIYSIYFINGGKPPYTVSSSTPLIGTIIGVGTTSAPLAAPSGTITVDTKTWTVQAGGYFVVAWPDAGASGTGPYNHCAFGDASFKITDADGNQPTTVPSFKLTVKEE